MQRDRCTSQDQWHVEAAELHETGQRRCPGDDDGADLGNEVERQRQNAPDRGLVDSECRRGQPGCNATMALIKACVSRQRWICNVISSSACTVNFLWANVGPAGLTSLRRKLSREASRKNVMNTTTVACPATAIRANSRPSSQRHATLH